jgi:hypothetical protein
VCTKITDSKGNVSYKWERIHPNKLISSIDFTVTDHYVVQTNPLSNIANTNIYFDSNPLSYWLEKN